jgi:hypothetical protein
MSPISYFWTNQQVISTPDQQVRIGKFLNSLVAIMDLILNINRVGPQGEGEHTATTCVMVTHNPDIECYADRILYV